MDRSQEKKQNLAALPLVAPFVLIYVALFIYPSLQMVMMTFTDSALTQTGQWIGFDNYLKLLGDRQFGRAVANTLYFAALTVVPSTLVGLGLAIVVNRLNGVWQGLVLAAFFIPYILPVSTVTSIAFWITNTETGPLGGFVRNANDFVIPIWRVSGMFFPAVAILTIWWTVGFNVLIFLAGLRALPRDIYEAAHLDRASHWTVVRKITWPLMWPVTALVLTIQLILQLKVFDQVFLIASRGQTGPSMVMVQYVYTVAFQRNQAGYASTAAVALFALVAIVSVLQFRLLQFRASK